MVKLSEGGLKLLWTVYPDRVQALSTSGVEFVLATIFSSLVLRHYCMKGILGFPGPLSGLFYYLLARSLR